MSDVIGTPAYMAPEQITGTDIRAPADVFAWAATVAFAVNGASPFAGRSSVESMYRVLEDPPDLGGMDGPLRPLVERCLAKDPADRPAARELLFDLLAVLGSATDHAVPVPVEGPTEEIRTERMLGLGATRATTAVPGTRVSTRPDRDDDRGSAAAPPRPRRTRLLVLAGIAAVLVAAAVVAVVTLLPILTAPSATAIPAEFAGRWTGTGRLLTEGTTIRPRTPARSRIPGSPNSAPARATAPPARWSSAPPPGPTWRWTTAPATGARPVS